MSKSLTESFDFKPIYNADDSVVSDYEVFKDKKLLDELRKIIIEDLVDKEIPATKELSEFVNEEIDKCLEGYDLTNLQTDGKVFAKVLFIVGLENKNYQENMKLMDNICEKMNKQYKGICKGLYKKQGEGVNGVYNQDIDKNVLLIELGGVDNTTEEISNTLDVFVKSLKEYIGETNEK